MVSRNSGTYSWFDLMLRLQDDIRSSQTVQSSEGMQGWLTMLFGIAANGLSEYMPCLCKRLLCKGKVNKGRAVYSSAFDEVHG